MSDKSIGPEIYSKINSALSDIRRLVGDINFTPEEIIEHEKALYPKEERLSLELLEKNYKKYFLDHIKEIKAYTGLICK